MDIEIAKRAAANAAVSYIEDNITIGLGTGSTAYYAIQLIGQKVMSGLNIQAVPTSKATERLALDLGIPLVSEFTRIDVTIDGADEVDEFGNMIKGGGGALTREKIVAAASEKEIIIVDESKLVKRLGRFPLPVEILPFGWRSVLEGLRSLGGTAGLRKEGEKVFKTDNQNYVLDCRFNSIDNPGELAKQIKTFPGVVETGLFVELTDLVVVGREDGSVSIMEF